MLINICYNDKNWRSCMLEPVSNKIEKGIESQYFNIKYRPGL